ncbi:hypothetical protein EON66_11980 [archaeon]|nr:MAG: hypothetical protein EON66_11980 [archaeon]
MCVCVCVCVCVLCAACVCARAHALHACSRFVLRNAAPYVKKREGSTYRLVGVSNHMGTLSGGHYTAYVLCFHSRCKTICRRVSGSMHDHIGLKRFAARCTSISRSPCARRTNLRLAVTFTRQQYDGSRNTASFSFSCMCARLPNCCSDCLNKHDGRWYRFNDSMVTPISSSNISSVNAYLLFYVRQDA